VRFSLFRITVMRFRPFVAGFALACAASLSMPEIATAQTQISGGGALQVLSGCSGVWSGVTRIRTRARLAGMPGNHPTNDRISIFTPSYAAHFRVDSAAPLNTWRQAIAAGWIGSLGGYGTLAPQPWLRRLAVPAGARNTGEIYLRYEVFDFDQLPGCAVRLDLLFRDRRADRPFTDPTRLTMRFAHVCLLVLGLGAAATAAPARTLVGGGFVHQFAQVCQPTNAAIANLVNTPMVTYVAGEVTGGPSQLVFAYTDGTIALQAEAHFPRAGSFVRAVGRSLNRNGLLNYRPRPAYRVLQRLVVQPLNAPIAQAEQVYMRVAVRNWWGIEGCNVEAVLTLGARPATEDAQGPAVPHTDEAGMDGGGALPPAR
jgi:hypothetical protein